MNPKSKQLGWVAAAILAGIAAAVAPHVVSRALARRSSLESRASEGGAPAVGMPGGPPTSSAGLLQRISEMEGRLQEVGERRVLADLPTSSLGRSAELLRQAAVRLPQIYELEAALGLPPVFSDPEDLAVAITRAAQT